MAPPLPQPLPPPLPSAPNHSSSRRNAIALSNNTNEELSRKRKFEELEIQERIVEIERKRAAVHEHYLSIMEKCLEVYSTLSANRMMIDERGRRSFKEKIIDLLNLISKPNGEEEEEDDAF